MRTFINLVFLLFFHVFLHAQQNSVLKSGDWFKIEVSQDGIYQITKNDLQSLGINTSNLSVNSVKLYGNGGGMLPALNSIFRYNDLQENAIEVIDKNGNGIFNNDDYILFFGESANEWILDTSSNTYQYHEHLYSDKNYYYITIDNSSVGKRIIQKPILTTFDKTITSFNDFQVHEINSENLIQSGREWYGERFGIIDKYSFGFNFPNLNTSSPVFVKTSVAARSLNSSSFSISGNGNFLSNINVSKIVYDYATEYAKAGLSSNQFLSNSDQINIEIEYNYSESNAIGWLNYIELNARRDLRINNDFLHFLKFSSKSEAMFEQGAFVDELYLAYSL